MHAGTDEAPRMPRQPSFPLLGGTSISGLCHPCQQYGITDGLRKMTPLVWRPVPRNGLPPAVGGRSSVSSRFPYLRHPCPAYIWRPVRKTRFFSAAMLPAPVGHLCGLLYAAACFNCSTSAFNASSGLPSVSHRNCRAWR